MEDILRKMPKVELHVHLEGSIRPETLLTLAKRNEVALPASSVEELRKWYRFTDFRHFVDVYVASTKCIRTEDDVELIAYEFLRGQAEQNVLHSEVTFTIETVQRYCGIPWERQLLAVQRAADRAREEHGVTMELILDIVRELPPEVGEKVVDWAIAWKDRGVCAVGLSGDERKASPEVHANAFRRAREAGMPIATHAGETSGPESIWSCLDDLGANRIGHGVRCLEDDALVERLLADQTPLEVCPTSNVKLCVADSIEDHPIQAMITRGLNVSVNSDDPPIFDTTLTNEWIECGKAFDWNREQVQKLSFAALDASFCSEGRRSEIKAAFRDFWNS